MPLRYAYTPQVLQNLADLEQLGLLPYRPSPFAAILSGLARGLLPLAQVREARRLEEEEKRRERAQALGQLLPMYEPGTPEAQRAFEVYREVAGLPATIPAPPPDPERQLRLAQARVGILAQVANLPPEHYQVARQITSAVGIELPETPPVDPEAQMRFINTMMTTLRQTPPQLRPAIAQTLQAIGQRWNVPLPDDLLTMTETEQERMEREYTSAQIALAKAQARTAEDQSRPLKDVLPEDVQGIVKQRYGESWLNLPLYMAEPMVTQLVKEVSVGDLQPATQVLPPSAINWLKTEMKLTEEQIARLTVADIKNRFPQLLLGSGTVAEMFGNEWMNIVRQHPFLAPLGRMWATPEVVAQVIGAIGDIYANAQNLTRQYLLNVQKQLEDAVTRGASPEYIGYLIGVYNGLAPQAGLQLIDDERARRMMEQAGKLLNISVAELQLRMQKILFDMKATAERLQISRAQAAETARHHRVMEGLAATRLTEQVAGRHQQVIRWAYERAAKDWDAIINNPMTMQELIQHFQSQNKRQPTPVDWDRMRNEFIRGQAMRYLQFMFPQRTQQPKTQQKPQRKPQQQKQAPQIILRRE
ncbi:MAG: hypothetical protein RMK89_04225 [Armatimonadota bacterium]|nr:hypothetical protein [Armatimonadota bacterium]MDW8142653.1 hypothetical protein [Armatimonadota bacterium]